MSSASKPQRSFVASEEIDGLIRFDTSAGLKFNYQHKWVAPPRGRKLVLHCFLSFLELFGADSLVMQIQYLSCFWHCLLGETNNNIKKETRFSNPIRPICKTKLRN